ncbi:MULTISPECIES: N-acetyltransferase [unclassified Actinomyces]|uniref:GNAT family N-acetyltransferase n=1 Tax=unclassified Actinomyces TaxID=2609248 RepID=UPI000D590DD4|nr:MULTISPECIES: GNAT family N-acetyltransferase [unclassified Actinomyces]RAX23592.1 GNAT family N-acetyltransferase [Actinomyces sp. Z3]
MNSTRTSAPEYEHAPTVIELGLQDAGEILTLQRAAYITEATAHSDFGLPPLTQTLAELQEELSDPAVTARGIRDRGCLIAAMRLRHKGDAVELGRLIVAPDRQGQGLGTLLLRHAEAVFPDAREIRLFTGEHSAANIRLYERLGYREAGRTTAGSYQLVHFTKPLTRAGRRRAS